MLKNILAFGNTLSRTEQKSINGGRATFTHADPDGQQDAGDLCNYSGPAHTRCKPGLRCDVTGANIGICKAE